MTRPSAPRRFRGGPRRPPYLLRAAAFGLLALGSLGGCAGAEDARQKELDGLRGDIMRLRNEHTSLRSRLDTIEMARAQAPRPATVDRPELATVKLGPDEAPAAPAADEVEGPGGRVVLRTTKAGTVMEEQPAESAKGGPEAQRDLDKATELHKAKSYDKAIASLSAFLARYPDHPSADVATYLRGDAYWQKGDAKRAVEQLETVVHRYPFGNRTPDALARLVEGYAKLGQAAKSDLSRKKLLSEYPSSDAAKKSQRPSSPPSPYEP